MDVVLFYQDQLSKLRSERRQLVSDYLWYIYELGIRPSDFGEDNWSDVVGTLVKFEKTRTGLDKPVVVDYLRWLETGR